MNVSEYTPTLNNLTEVFSLLGQPERLNILLAISHEHACVCHLEKVLGLRQAYISQQLMLLRKSGLVITERSGRHIFYSLSDPRWLDLIHQAASILNIGLPGLTLPEIEGCCYKPCNSNKTR
jgi:ArsR family transcriptional regulator